MGRKKMVEDGDDKRIYLSTGALYVLGRAAPRGGGRRQGIDQVAKRNRARDQGHRQASIVN
jgi:hypothetical protein